MGLESLYKEGFVKAIGVSNFLASHLHQLIEDGVEIMPMLNQIEVHPLFCPKETIDVCRSNGIAVQAYAPLGAGPLSNAAKASGGKANGTRILLEHAAVLNAAEAHKRTAAQVLLRWGLQHEHALVVKSGTASRIVENARVFDFDLSPEQMAAISQIQDHEHAQKFCWDPSAIK